MDPGARRFSQLKVRHSVRMSVSLQRLQRLMGSTPDLNSTRFPHWVQIRIVLM
jgi:hypothetical protein